LATTVFLRAIHKKLVDMVAQFAEMQKSLTRESMFNAAIFKYFRNILIKENIQMRAHIIIVIAFLTLFLLVPCGIVYSQSSIEYTIQIENDGSAAWTITQTGTQIQSSIDSLIQLRSRVVSLIEAAQNITQRAMVADENEFSLSSNFSGSYVTVEYRFYWQNFSKIENTNIIIGDVFQVKSFFDQLYGDGQVYMTYPTEYTVQEASPVPYERNDSLHTLRWLGTTDFVAGQSTITLEEQPPTSGFINTTGQNVIIIASLIVLAAGSSTGLYVFRRRKRKKAKQLEISQQTTFPEIENDEDKIVNLLKSSTKGLYQSAIAEQFRFSRAKTSQLLTALENKGIVKRQKRGREKIVVLVQQNEK
jgi:uncharacterized membrane protein